MFTSDSFQVFTSNSFTVYECLLMYVNEKDCGVSSMWCICGVYLSTKRMYVMTGLHSYVLLRVLCVCVCHAWYPVCVCAAGLQLWRRS